MYVVYDEVSLVMTPLACTSSYRTTTHDSLEHWSERCLLFIRYSRIRTFNYSRLHSATPKCSVPIAIWTRLFHEVNLHMELFNTELFIDEITERNKEYKNFQLKKIWMAADVC